MLTQRLAFLSLAALAGCSSTDNATTPASDGGNETSVTIDSGHDAGSQVVDSGSSDGGRDTGDFIVSACRPNCLGGIVSPQACKRNGECINGQPCVAYTCQDSKVWGLCEPTATCH